MNEMTRSPSAGAAGELSTGDHAPPRCQCRRPRPRRRAGAPPAWLWPLLGIGAVLAVYLVGRGVAELLTIHYGDPASYAKDWGGPSLAGVLAVHSGPGLVIIATGAWWWLRGRRTGLTR